MSNELKVAIEAAKKASQKALSYYNTNIQIETKNDSSPVTIADKEAEKAIRICIQAAFPNAKFVGEEGGGSRDENEFWTIDPIDGTKFFIHGIPLWSTLISLYRNGEIVLGLSYVPLIDELLYAEKGKGAFLNEKKVHVSTKDTLKDSFISYCEITQDPKLNNLLYLLRNSSFSASFYSSFGYHLVANGRAECFFEPHGKIWDNAPFKAIIEEAGGKITDLEGGEWTKDSTGAVATNGLIHDEVISILNQ